MFGFTMKNMKESLIKITKNLYIFNLFNLYIIKIIY